MTQPSYDLTNYRFYEDDNTEDANTALGSGNNEFLDRQTGIANRFCVRMELFNDNSKSGVESWSFEYSHNSGTYTAISTGSSVVANYSSVYLTDGENTTQRLSSSTPFLVANEGVDVNGTIPSVSVGADDYLEVLTLVYIKDADVNDNDEILIRVIEDSGDTITYLNEPRITVSKAAAPQTVTLNSITLVGSAEAITVTPAANSVATNELILVGSAESILQPVTISLNSLYLVSIVATYMEFDGSNSIVNCGSDGSLDDLADNEFTIEAWFKPDGYGQSNLGWLLSKGGTSAGLNSGWLIRITNYTGMDNYVATTGTYSRDNTRLGNPYIDTGFHHLAVYFNDAGDRAVHNALDGNWITGTHSIGEGPIETDAGTDLIFGNRSDNGAYAWDGGIGWVRISNNDRYNHGTNFTPPLLSIPPRIDANTIEQWNAKDGSGGTLTAEVLSPTNDGTLTDVTWVVGTEITVTASAVTISLNELTLSSSAEAINVSTVESQTVVLNELTLSGSAEAITVTPSAVTITTNELTLSSSLEALTSVTPSAVATILNTLTLSSSIGTIRALDFVPTDLSNLSMWIDFSDPSTLEVTSGVPISNDGDTIYKVSDKSNKNYDFTQITASIRPTYKTGIQNGLSVSWWDGTGTNMRSPYLSLTGTYATDEVDIFLVLNQDSNKTQNSPFNSRATTNLNTINIYATYNDTLYFDYGDETSGGRIFVSQPTGWDNEFHIIETYRSSSNGEIGVDNTILLNDTFSDDFDNTPQAYSNIGAVFPGSISNFLGYIGEIIVSRTALSSTNRDNVLQYLSDKWLITLNQSISLNTLTLSSSVEAITVTASASTVTLNELTLSGSAEQINITIGGADLSVTLNTLTLASSTQLFEVSTDVVVIHRRQFGRRWIYFPMHIGGEEEVAPTPTVTLSALTLSSSAETLSAITPAAVSITLNTLTLSSSTEAITVTPGIATITVNTLTLSSSLEALTVTAGVATVTLNELTLVSSAEALTVVPGIVSVTLNELTLVSSLESITVTAGTATITLNELTLVGSAEQITVTPSAATITLNELTLSSSVIQINITLGAASVLLDTLTLASSAQTISIPVIIRLDTLILASSTEAITITPASVTITLDTLTLSSSAIQLSIAVGAESIPLNTLTLVSSLEALTVVASAATVTVNTLTLTSSAEILTVVGAAVSVTTNTLTLASSTETITIAIGAASVQVNTLTLSSSIEAITITGAAVTIALSELTLVSSVETITVTIGAVSVTLSTLTLSSSIETLTVTASAASITLTELTLVSSAEQITVTGAAVTITTNTLTLVSSTEIITVSLGAASLLMDTLTLSSSLPAITITPAANSVLLDTVILVATAVSVTIRVPLAIDGLHGVTLSDIIVHETAISDTLIQSSTISDTARHTVGVTDKNDNS